MRKILLGIPVYKGTPIIQPLIHQAPSILVSPTKRMKVKFLITNLRLRLAMVSEQVRMHHGLELYEIYAFS